MTPMPLSEAYRLPLWRRPEALLILMAMAMPISFATWSALLNNFAIERVGFDGADIGLLHSIREIPGFLAIGVIAVLIFVREQTLALVSLALLGVATMATAAFPSLGGILVITLLSSIGFHYYETVNQSLQLQWIDKKDAPLMLGRLIAIGSGATLTAYLVIISTWKLLDLDFTPVYMVAGGVTLGLVALAALTFPHFASPHPQRRELVLRKRYWLYYVLQFMAGARRQIFVVFAGFMMVERFGLSVDQMTRILMITLVANMVTAPLIGRAIARFGERRALALEYFGLSMIFLAYAGVYQFDWGVVFAGALYVGNNILFAMSLALKTYFQKIADPTDIAPTAAVAFTINHIAAVFLPVGLGLLWLISPQSVFMVATGLALGSCALSLLIPRHPAPGHETRLRPLLAAAPLS